MTRVSFFFTQTVLVWKAKWKDDQSAWKTTRVSFSLSFIHANWVVAVVDVWLPWCWIWCLFCFKPCCPAVCGRIAVFVLFYDVSGRLFCRVNRRQWSYPVREQSFDVSHWNKSRADHICMLFEHLYPGMWLFTPKSLLVEDKQKSGEQILESLRALTNKCSYIEAYTAECTKKFV